MMLTCGLCGSDMPSEAVKELGNIDVMCVDEEACKARSQGRQSVPNTLPWLIGRVNALQARVEVLEGRDRMQQRDRWDYRLGDAIRDAIRKDYQSRHAPETSSPSGVRPLPDAP